MPINRVTPEVSNLAQALRVGGSSYTVIAQQVNDQLGIALDASAIRRHLDRIGGKGRDRSKELARHASRKSSLVPIAVLPTGQAPQAPPQGVAATPLDEITSLEAQAQRLNLLLLADMPARDRAALVKELRGCFASIRAAKGVVQTSKSGQSDGTSWVIAKLRKFAAQANPTFNATLDSDAATVPAEPHSAVS